MGCGGELASSRMWQWWCSGVSGVFMFVSPTQEGQATL